MDKKKRLIIFCFIICGLIILLVGFAIGYLYGDRGCMENPFVYGAKEMNKLNNNSIECSCYYGKNTFYFNSERISLENPNINSNFQFVYS